MLNRLSYLARLELLRLRQIRDSAVAALERVLAGATKPGFQTPSLAFGPDFILGVEGVSREDLPG